MKGNASRSVRCGLRKYVEFPAGANVQEMVSHKV